MNRTKLRLLFVLVVYAFCGATYVKLRQANRQLAFQVNSVRAEATHLRIQRVDNQNLRYLVERMRVDGDGARREMDDQIGEARQEVLTLERHAGEQFLAKQIKDRAAADTLTRNRDLTKGPVLTENCANVGRGTPVDALQTLVWAALKGDDDEIARILSVSGLAREFLLAAISALPEAQREKYPTPERLAGLYAADVASRLAAVHVVAASAQDAQHTVLSVERLNGKTMDLPMQLGFDGWQIALNEVGSAKKITSYLLGAPLSKK